MSFFQALLTTEGTGDVFGIIGDSNADGRGGSIPTVASNTLYLWGGSSFSQITTQSVSNNDNTKGSIWQQMATDYKALTGRPVYLVNGGWGGSEFYPNGDNTNWYTSGDLYTPFITELDQALAARNAIKPTALIMNLGINDCRAATSVANVQTGITSLLDRLVAKYPGTPILCIVPGKAESNTYNDQRFYQIRAHLIQKAQEMTDVHILCNAGQFVDISGMYQSDDIHYHQAMNDIIGSMIGRWFANGGVSNKWARTLISSHFDVLNNNRKDLINTFVTNQYNNGNYFKLESLLVYKTTTANNLYIDWTFVSFGREGPFPVTFTANDNISSNGSSTYCAFSYVNSFYNRSGAGQNDFIIGVKLKTNSQTAGTSGTLFGRSASPMIRLAQSTATITYHANVVSGSSRTVSGNFPLSDNTLHSVARNGGTEYYIKNTTITDTHSLASSGAMTATPLVGANGTAGSPAVYLNGTYEYAFAAKYDGFDLSSFYTDIEYLIAHWND